MSTATPPRAVFSTKANRAHYPFDDSEGSDAVLRSVDHVDFYVHRIILSIASPVLKDQLAKLPQTGASKPVVHVPETSQVLYVLLRVCYPLGEHLVSSITLVRDVLEAALKYDIKTAVEVMKRHLNELVEHQPLRVFAVACQLSLEETASLAAKTLLRVKPNVLETINNGDAENSYLMKNVSAGAFHRLRQFLKTGEKTTFCNESTIWSYPVASAPTSSKQPATIAPHLPVRRKKVVVKLPSSTFAKLSASRALQSASFIQDDTTPPRPSFFTSKSSVFESPSSSGIGAFTDRSGSTDAIIPCKTFSFVAPSPSPSIAGNELKKDAALTFAAPLFNAPSSFTPLAASPASNCSPAKALIPQAPIGPGNDTSFSFRFGTTAPSVSGARSSPSLEFSAVPGESGSTVPAMKGPGLTVPSSVLSKTGSTSSSASLDSTTSCIAQRQTLPAAIIHPSASINPSSCSGAGNADGSFNQKEGEGKEGADESEACNAEDDGESDATNPDSTTSPEEYSSEDDVRSDASYSTAFNTLPKSIPDAPESPGLEGTSSTPAVLLIELSCSSGIAPALVPTDAAVPTSPVSTVARPDTPRNSQFNFDDSDLIISSSDGVSFRVHHLILRFAAPRMLENVNVGRDKKTLSLPESSRVVMILLQGCYPSMTIEKGLSINELSLALGAAARYKMKKVVKKLLSLLKYVTAASEEAGQCLSDGSFD